MKIRLGITSGDPAGIGAEIIVKALSHDAVYSRCVPIVIGDEAVIADAVGFCRSSLKIRCIEKPDEARGEKGTIDVLDVKTPGFIKGSWPYGKVSLICGEASYRYIERAIQLSLSDEIDGIVTAPINKESVNLAGHHYAGHTEILADLTDTKDYAMLLTSSSLRVIHVSTHVSLREAAALVTKERVLTTMRLADKALRLLGIASPRIAVAGLNPHASERGLFGKEEEREIIPAVEAACREGLNAKGPLPADTVFVRALGGDADVVVAMFHDQGHIPLKLVGFKVDPATGRFTKVSGVNCTLGLPIIRTSVDHGTAFDRAGKNISNEQSLVEAIEMAATMAENRKAK